MGQKQLFGKNFFYVHFVTKVSLYFWNLRKKTDILIPILTYSKKKNFWPYLVDSENFGPQECDFRPKLFKIRKNVFTKQVLDFV
jgi:hypothetical protein